MSDQDHLSTEILRHGAYLCLRPKPGTSAAELAAVPIPGLADGLGLENEFAPAARPPRNAIAFLRRQAATAGDVADEEIERADWVIHVASKAADPVADFCAAARKELAPYADVRVLGGVVRPREYSGAAMERFAYARAVVQRPGTAMPNGFLIPMSKTADWWRKGWMERHTYFLPRYDDDGRLVAEGHALAAAAGIPRLLRRTFHAPAQPAPPGSYDFLTYFECADEDVGLFAEICARLRDVERNPEWKFVREGPTWHGRRVATWEELVTVPIAPARPAGPVISSG